MVSLTAAQKYWRHLVTCITPVIVLLFAYYMFYLMTLPQNKRSVPKVSVVPPVKKILFWNSYFNHRHFNFGLGRRPFIYAGCGETHCKTFTRKHLNATPVEEYDAIIFHGWNLIHDDLPARRRPHQRYILYVMESPMLFPNNLGEAPEGFFNWTLTYRLDSDIIGTYGYFKTLDEPKRAVLPPNQNWVRYPSELTEYDLPERTRIKVGNKTKLVAWFVSHCETPGRREEYVRELKKYIDIDVYGYCGTLTCDLHDQDRCFEKLENEYKFYLSFENSICQDYVTEKLFNIMKYNVVPIVYGGGNYSQLAPPGSYINVKDFNEPWLLAQYLLDLDAYPEDYIRYFWWRSYYEPVVTNTHHFCQLCELLNDQEAPPKSYRDINDWFLSNDTCQNMKDYINIGLGQRFVRL